MGGVQPAMTSMKMFAILIGASALLPLGAEVRSVVVPRGELADILVNYRVSIATVDGATTKATVLGVNDTGISTSNARRSLIPFGAIKEIRMTEYIGRGRTVGAVVGSSVGVLLGLTAAGALRISGDQPVDKTTATLLSLTGGPLGALAGHLIGKRADRQTVVITIAP